MAVEHDGSQQVTVEYVPGKDYETAVLGDGELDQVVEGAPRGVVDALREFARLVLQSEQGAVEVQVSRVQELENDS